MQEVVMASGRCAIALVAFAALCAPALGEQRLPELGGRMSCSTALARDETQPVRLEVTRVPLQGVNPARTTIGALNLVGGFHLSSAEKGFGGLSGLDVLEDGDLLAVTDAGEFVWIALDADGVTPVAARMADMRDMEDRSIRSKTLGDAEGLAVADGVALVSFEGEHRILAFDIAECGAGAKGVPIVSSGDLAEAFARQGLSVGGNAGLEALAVAPDGFLLAGLETRAGEASAVSASALEAPPVFDIRMGEGAPPLVGMDILATEDDSTGFTLYSLHRATRALASEVIVILETRFERDVDQSGLPARIVSEADERARTRFRPTVSRKLAAMNVFVTIDNFEGIAARRLPDGRVRLYLIADDNFSASQRTLLMVYDVVAPR
jgi:hypothetical protein